MAGDWIKMRVNLATHPKVMRIAEFLLRAQSYIDWADLAYKIPDFPPPSDVESRKRKQSALRVTRYVTVCALLRFWGYANEHINDDEVIDGLHPEDVDEIAGVPNFCAALESVGWLDYNMMSEVMTVQNFNKYNVSANTRGASNAERQRRYRERKKGENVTDESNVTRYVTSNAREEKRREEKIDTTGVPPAPKGAIVDAYHELLPNNPRIKLWTKGRDTALRTRWREMWGDKYSTVDDGVAWWRKYFGFVAESKFLTGMVQGGDGRTFVADIDFLLRPGKFASIIEGKYVD